MICSIFLAYLSDLTIFFYNLIPSLLWVQGSVMWAPLPPD